MVEFAKQVFPILTRPVLAAEGVAEEYFCREPGVPLSSFDSRPEYLVRGKAGAGLAGGEGEIPLYR